MKPRSLRLRLVAGGAAALLIALGLAGVGLAYLFERQVLRSLAEDLEFDLKQALASIELDAAGKPLLAREPSDPRFAVPLSGLYWQVVSPAGSARSRSLWDATLPMPEDVLAPGDSHRHRLPGPDGSELIAVERTVLLSHDGAAVPVRLVFGADLGRVAEARRSFVSDLVPALALLGTVLGTAMWIQIGLGLAPLERIRGGVAAVRDGRSRRLESPLPAEVAPLVDEINSLLSAKEREMERSRDRAADLAHGLKTPLSALAADVRELQRKGEADIAGRIADVGEAMRRHVERELARARIRAGSGPPSASTELRPLVEALIAIQRRTAEGERLTFDTTIPEHADVQMDRADLAEVLGNLLENAARQARSRVAVTWLPGGRVRIDDDGPGIEPELRDMALRRGRRLDETGGSAGLGLAIVQDVLEAYGRPLRLDTSPSGGLTVEF